MDERELSSVEWTPGSDRVASARSLTDPVLVETAVAINAPVFTLSGNDQIFADLSYRGRAFFDPRALLTGSQHWDVMFTDVGDDVFAASVDAELIGDGARANVAGMALDAGFGLGEGADRVTAEADVTVDLDFAARVVASGVLTDGTLDLGEGANALRAEATVRSVGSTVAQGMAYDGAFGGFGRVVSGNGRDVVGLFAEVRRVFDDAVGLDAGPATATGADRVEIDLNGSNDLVRVEALVRQEGRQLSADELPGLGIHAVEAVGADQSEFFLGAGLDTIAGRAEVDFVTGYGRATGVAGLRDSSVFGASDADLVSGVAVVRGGPNLSAVEVYGLHGVYVDTAGGADRIEARLEVDSSSSAEGSVLSRAAAALLANWFLGSGADTVDLMAAVRAEGFAEARASGLIYGSIDMGFGNDRLTAAGADTAKGTADVAEAFAGSFGIFGATVRLGGGNDVLRATGATAGVARSTISGGDGNDEVVTVVTAPPASPQALATGIVDSTVQLGSGNDFFFALGADPRGAVVPGVIEVARSTIHLGNGDDLFRATNVLEAVVEGGSGADHFTLGAGTAQIDGGTGIDSLELFGSGFIEAELTADGAVGIVTERGADIVVRHVELFSFGDNSYTLEELLLWA